LLRFQQPCAQTFGTAPALAAKMLIPAPVFVAWQAASITWPVPQQAGLLALACTLVV